LFTYLNGFPVIISMAECGYIIREAADGDLRRIYEIETAAFQSGWTLENLSKELSASFSLVLVADSGGAVIAYISAWLVRGEIQINRLAVLEEHRRRGIAGSLLTELVRRSGGSSPFKILLEVREKNDAARSFYRARGFIESGLRKGYYRDDNAILLEKELGT
jgi:ribosomal-protein-alanine acetyltransferase